MEKLVKIQKLNLIRAHQKPVIQLVCTTLSIITSSYDCTIKLFNILTMRVTHTLTGHDLPVMWFWADVETNVNS